MSFFTAHYLRDGGNFVNIVTTYTISVKGKKY